MSHSDDRAVPVVEALGPEADLDDGHGIEGDRGVVVRAPDLECRGLEVGVRDPAAREQVDALEQSPRHNSGGGERGLHGDDLAHERGERPAFEAVGRVGPQRAQEALGMPGGWTTADMTQTSSSMSDGCARESVEGYCALRAEAQSSPL